jgi:hypothetical protein
MKREKYWKNSRKPDLPSKMIWLYSNRKPKRGDMWYTYRKAEAKEWECED